MKSAAGVRSLIYSILVNHFKLSIPHSEYHVFITIVTQYISASLGVFLSFVLLIARSPFLSRFNLLLLCLSLFQALDFLQSVELLTIHLIKLGVDILDRILRTRDDDVLAVGHQYYDQYIARTKRTWR